MPAEVEEPPAAKERLAPGTLMALFAMGLGVFVIGNDFTALNVALPAIESDFDVDVGSVQWVVNAYALVFGMLIVTGGRLADMFGRRKVLFVGAGIFGLFSAIGAAAPDLGVLIAARVGMGVGAAMMWPAILGMTFAALPESKAGLAGGLVLGVAGFSNAVGPLLGGTLTELLDWRWIFVINVPIAVFAILVTRAKVHQHQELEREGIDLRGIALLSGGLLLLMLALDQAVDWGWGDWRVITMLLVAAIMVVAFAVLEPRIGNRALMPPDVIGNWLFRSACVAVVLMSAVFFTVMLYLPQFFEKLLDFSAIEAGLGMLPMMASFAVMSFIAGSLYDRIGGRLEIAIGAALLAIGMILLATIDQSSGYGSIVPGLTLTGLGVGLFYPTVTTIAVTTLDSARASLAGGIVFMCQIAGGAVGLAAATAIFTASSESRLRDDVAEQTGTQLTAHQQAVLHGELAGTDAAAAALAELPSRAAAEITTLIHDSFAIGIQTNFRVVAGLAIAGFLVSVFVVGRRIASPAEPVGDEAAEQGA